MRTELERDGDAAVSPEVLALIGEHFPLQPVPLSPEIRVRRAVPNSGLWRLAELDDRGFDTPYWAHHWGGGIVLARYLLDHPQAVAGRRVLDLGCGSGVVAIAAAKAGAAKVVCADVDKYAAAAARLNADANGVAVSVVIGDLTRGPPPDAELVLVGDLFYERELARRVEAFLDRCLAAHIEVLVGDPFRAFLPQGRLRLLAEYDPPDFGEGRRRSAVFRFAAA